MVDLLRPDGLTVEGGYDDDTVRLDMVPSASDGCVRICFVDVIKRTAVSLCADLIGPAPRWRWAFAASTLRAKLDRPFDPLGRSYVGVWLRARLLWPWRGAAAEAVLCDSTADVIAAYGRTFEEVEAKYVY